MRLLKRRSQRLVACVYCAGTGWRYQFTVDALNGDFSQLVEYLRCSECAGSGDFVSRTDT